MNKRNFIIKICAIVFVCLLVVVTAVATSLNYGESSEPNTNYGTYTFSRSMELNDGENVRFYESGDNYFRYYHDENGYILIRDYENNTLEYAVNNGKGRPVASGVSYNASEFIIKNTPKMTALDIDFSSNQDLLMEYPISDDVDVMPLYSGGTTHETIVNLVIYIQFNDDYSFSFSSNDFNSYYNAGTNSLRNYYEVMSKGNLTINSMYPVRDSVLPYVYKAPNNREYYNVKDSNSTTRRNREKELLNGAVEEAKNRFSLSGLDLDTNNDEYIDSVSFLINGSTETTWGGLLWPHSWNLASINGNNDVKIGGVTVGDFTFNFTDSLDVGVICHEMGHVLGAPDLYHYEYDFVPVGKWDLMQFNMEIPQYMLTYMRKTYVGGIPDTAIVEISKNGVYSLSPVSSNPDVLAYRINSDRADEYFMVEYRKPSANGGYDTGISGAGLLVYRIKEGVTNGNRDALYKKSAYPDEVYVFRPSVNLTGKELSTDLIYSRSGKDVELAYLSPNNVNFSSVGSFTNTTKYNNENIYYTDGTNAGIVISALSISDESIEFSVKVDPNDTVSDDYFDDKLHVNEAVYTNTSFAGVNLSLTLNEIDVENIVDLSITLEDVDNNPIATNTLNVGKFRTAYASGMRTFNSQFIVGDKGNNIESVFSYGEFLSDSAPVSAKIYVVDADGDKMLVKNIAIDDNDTAWSMILSAKTSLSASVEAGSRITLGVRTDGTVSVSGTGNEVFAGIKNATGVVKASAGVAHTLAVLRNLTVMAYGANYNNECNVSGWRDIKDVSAGNYTSYGVTTDGNVMAVGLNNYGQLNVQDWKNIIKVDAGARHVAGVDTAGKVYAVGDNANGQLNVAGLTDIIDVACGNTFTACLKSDGTVVIVGTLANGNASEWENITLISAGNTHLVGLKADGKVVSTGDNTYGQASTINLYDIEDVSCGEYHTAYLRKDGVVEYRGEGNSQYGTNTELKNLKYADTEYVKATGVQTASETYRVAKGESIYLTTTIMPVTATYKRAIFATGDVNVATVSATGEETAKITGISVGKTSITIRLNGTGITKKIDVEVYETVALQDIVFADSEKSILIGETAQLTLLLQPENAIAQGTPYYRSSDESIVSIDQNGVITAGDRVGSATIYAVLDGKVAECTINVVSTIDSISLLTTNLQIKYDQEISWSELFMDVVIGNSTERIALTEDMIKTDYSITAIDVSQTISVEYMGHVKTFVLTVRNYVTGVAISTLPRTEYAYGEGMKVTDFVDGKLNVEYAYGSKEEKIDISYVSGYDAGKVGMQTITITYIDSTWGTSFITVYDVKVEDTVLEISYNPENRNYYFGDEYRMTDEFTIKMNSGAIRYKEVFDATIENFDSTVLGDQIITLKYFDDVAKVEHSVEAYVNVSLGNDFVINGANEDGKHYFEVGGNLGLTVTVIQNDGDVISIAPKNSEEDTVWVSFSGFDNNTMAEHEVVVSIYGKTREYTGSEYVVKERLVAVVGTINAFGKKQSERLSLVYERTEFKYGEDVDVKIKVEYTDGTVDVIEPMEEAYDPETVDIEQIYYARYIDEWLELPIIIHDYVMGLQPIEDKVTKYNVAISISVYAIMAKNGVVKLNASDYQVSNYSLTDVSGTQTVTVSYMTFATSFKLTVNDTFSSIAVKESIKKDYLYKEDIDLTSKYVITMESGAKKEVSYDSNFYYRVDHSATIKFDNTNTSNQQIISIYYRSEFGDVNVCDVYVMVHNYVEKLVVENGSKLDYEYGEALEISVKAVYANGASEKLKNTQYTTTYDAKKAGVQQIVIRYVDNYAGIVTSLATVTVNDTIISAEMATYPNVRSYNFGEALSWVGAVLKVDYAGGTSAIYRGNEIKVFPITYNPTKTGTQYVVVNLGENEVRFSVNVSVENDTVLSYSITKEGLTFDRANRKFVVDKEGLVVSDVFAPIVYAKYLTANYVSSGTEIDAPTTSTRKLRTGDKVVLKNADEVVVYELVVYLYGDASGDGIFDSDDVDSVAQAIASGSVQKDVMDYDLDGEVSLTDLVNWARKANPLDIPNNMPSKKFISDVKIRKKENGEIEI